MTITAIKCYPTWQGHRNICLVKVECGELHGWGEAGLSGRELAVAGAVDHYSQFLVGQDGMRISALWQEMYRSQYFEGGRTLTAAISAIDIALYDCLGPPVAPAFCEYPLAAGPTCSADARGAGSQARSSACRCTSCSGAPTATTSRVWYPALPMSRRCRPGWRRGGSAYG